ncbi:MAG TPA: peptide MFS transporter [Thermoanaerobaculia bacterium]|jgi:POT family proton-dependent oligopeptide transporter
MTTTVPAHEKQWLGHPRGLFTLFFTEMWERFSYYGMRALLILYMTGSTVQSGLGFDVKYAAHIYALYTFLVYVSGVPGGWIADKFLGHKRAVVVGGVIIALGHFSMAIPRLQFFYLGLGLIIIGTGFLKTNVSTIVGSLYRKNDPRRDSGFAIFYMGINLGAAISPIIVGWLGQKLNWHIGFGAAGVGMVFGVIQYIAGQKYLVAASEIESAMPLEAAVEETPAANEPFTPADWGRMGAVVILCLFALIFWAGFEQAGSSLNLFADRATRLTFLGYTYPSSWFQSVEAFGVLIFSGVFAWLWLFLGRRRAEPSSPLKFLFGLVFASLSFLLLVPAARHFEATQQRVSPGWLIGAYLLQTFGELCLSPVGLNLVTKLAPQRVVGLMMGVWFFALGSGNYVAGWLAGMVQDRSYSQVFMIVFEMIAFAAVILLLLIKPIKKLMTERATPTVT